MSNELPLVCICVPTYNVAVTVRETLKSVLAQTYPNLVVHVSDNASTDETVRVVESIPDARINVHRQNENIGAEGNFTKCIQLATGKYTAIFHADDVYDSAMLAKQVAFLEANPDVGAVFTGARTIDENGVLLGVIGRAPDASGSVVRYSFGELLQAMLLHHNFLICPSAMVRTELYQEHIKKWGSSLFRSSSDIDTWLRLASKRPIAILNEPLMSYRISQAQFSESIRNRTERTDFFLVMDNYLARPDVMSFLTKDDLRHYGWLERHECVARALNLFVLGRSTEAKELLSGFFSRDTFSAAMHSRRGLVTLAGGSLLRFLTFIGMGNRSAAVIKSIKKIAWK
jgi:glycosyltransferase involved in cell wall biosynthesis